MLPGIDASRASLYHAQYPQQPDIPPPSPPPTPQPSASAAPTPGAGAAPRAPAAPVQPSFADSLRGQQPQAGDLKFAQMANDCYTRPSSGTSTGNQSEKDLRAQGWTRMQANGSTLRAENGRELTVDPSLLEDKNTGLRAAVYTDGQGHYVVAFAGTTTDNWSDALTDGAQAVGMSGTQYEQATQLARTVQQAAGTGNVAFTGHSLGGGLAATASAATGAPAVTFNAAGVSNETLRRLGFLNPNDVRAEVQNKGQIRSYSVDGDWLSTVGRRGAPEQLGTPWHTAWKSPQGDPKDPRNLIALHGLPGDNQSYVEIMRGSAMKPGIVENPYVTGATHLAFAPAGPLGLVPQVRGALLQQTGNTLETARGALSELVQIGGDTRAEVGADLRQDSPLAFLRVTGDVQEGALDATGSLFDQAQDFSGRTATVVTDHLGDGIRDTGQALGLPTGLTQFSARAVEYTGDATRLALDQSGDQVDTALDAAGTAADWASSKLADAGDAVLRHLPFM